MLHYDYTYLSNLFTKVKGMSIQKFIIDRKIEWVKELMGYDELSLTEISYKCNYSSVALLSHQFKRITGLNPTTYKEVIQNNSHAIVCVNVNNAHMIMLRYIDFICQLSRGRASPTPT